MSVTCNFKKFGLGREELEHLVDEGMDPYGCCLYEDSDRDPEDGRTYEERRFDEMWECNSSGIEETSDDFPDEAVEFNLRERGEEWMRREGEWTRDEFTGEYQAVYH